MRSLIPVLVGLGCATSTKPAPSSPSVRDSGVHDSGSSPVGPTWFGGVGHVVSEHCGACHQSGGLAENLSFEDPAMAAILSAAIAAATGEQVMPPFGAQESDECANPWGWLHDPRLSEAEVSLLAEWDATGAAIGTEDPAHPIPAPPSANLSGAEELVQPAGSWTTGPIGEVQDEFICFTIDPEISGDQWLDGVQVVPGNDLVVHHVLVGLDPLGSSKDLSDDNGVYDCFGGFGEVPGVTFIGAWVPGAAPITLPEYSALKVPVESRFVLQVHYHRAPTAQSDRTGLALRFTDQLPVRQATIGLVGNMAAQNADGSGLQPGLGDPSADPSFFIPADSANHTETMYAELFLEWTRPQEVFLAGNHMHYIGTEMRTWVERNGSSPVDEEACLLHTPSWDFDWQQLYQFDLSNGPGPLIYPGDALWLQCTFDNTLDNPAVVRALSESGLSDTIDVGLGEGSLDEMCIAILGTVPQVTFEVDDETHSGTVDVTISSTAFDFEQRCVGPASARIEPDGTAIATAACGLDVLGHLYTVELAFDGTLDEDGGLVGTVAASAMEVSGAVLGPLTGTPSEASFEASGSWASGDVQMVGTFAF